MAKHAYELNSDFSGTDSGSDGSDSTPIREIYSVNKDLPLDFSERESGSNNSSANISIGQISVAYNSSAQTRIWKDYVVSSLPPLLSLFSSISTMYAAQDVIKQALMAMGYEPDDIISDGQDTEAQSQLAITILTKAALWGLPMFTIAANSVLRYFSWLKVWDFLQKLRTQNSLRAYLPLLPYLLFAAPTDISDTTMNVLMSETLEKEWPTLAIKIESVLSLCFLLPINIHGVWGQHERLKFAYEKYTTGDDRKLLSRRLEAIFYELKNLPVEEQGERLNDLGQTGGFSGMPGGHSPRSYQEIMALTPEQLKRLAENICEEANLPDGSSWKSTVATGASIVFSLLAGAATMRSPYIFYTKTCEWPVEVAWALSTISGLTKAAFYMGSYDSLMWHVKHYNRLFGSAPVLYGLGAVLMVISAAGFWEVAERALAVAFEKATEDPTVWYRLLESIIFLAGVVSNTNAAAALVALKMEENRQNKLPAQLDLATGFKKRASEILQPKLDTVSTDEEQPLNFNSSNGASSSSSCCFSFFFRPGEQSIKYKGIFGPLQRVAGLAMGFNF
ncbi:MAG: hypothetical protein K0R48_121 [Gammaproteobacteria bacterium]|jgi:hypothetical protein|nr:hypothetical protein [Gammaproteobacteria bacterium]